MQNVAKELDGAGVGYAANLLRRLYTTGAKNAKRMALLRLRWLTTVEKTQSSLNTLASANCNCLLEEKPSSNTGAAENTTA